MESGDVHLISVTHKAAGMLVPSKLYSALAVGRPCIYIGPKRTEAAKVIHDFGAGSVIAQGRPRVLADEIKRYRLSADVWFLRITVRVRQARFLCPSNQSMLD